VNVKQAKQELRRIADIYPTLMGLLKREVAEGRTVGSVWAEILTRLEASDVEEAVDAYCSGYKSLPDPGDRLITEIVQTASDAAYERQRRWDQYAEVHARKKYVWREGSSLPVCVAIRYLLARGPVSADKVEELVAWGPSSRRLATDSQAPMVGEVVSCGANEIKLIKQRGATCQ
jgi:hypothetical protein